MAKGDSLRDLSRQLLTQRDDQVTPELVIAGSQQRIADAVEKLTVSYDQLRANLQSAKDQASYYHKRCKEKERKIAALKGVITKLKRKAVAP